MESWRSGKGSEQPSCYLENTRMATAFQVVNCGPTDRFASRDKMAHT